MRRRLSPYHLTMDMFFITYERLIYILAYAISASGVSARGGLVEDGGPSSSSATLGDARARLRVLEREGEAPQRNRREVQFPHPPRT